MGAGWGFFCSDNDGSDQRPDAWCKECDRMLFEEGEWNDRSEGFAQIKMVCAGCYDEIRRRNLTTVEGVNNGINTAWYLQNVRDTHELHPDTFSIPDAKIREGVKTGDVVKLIF